MTKSILTVAIAAAAIAIGSLAATGDAQAKKKGGFHNGKGGFSQVHRGNRWRGHRWHGHRWHKGYHFNSIYHAPFEPCYFIRRAGRTVKVCPLY